MHISFTPALGDRLSISLATSVTLQFAATLSENDHANLKRAGAKVQIWSNIPQSGRSCDEWGEHDFEDRTQDADADNLTELVCLVTKKEDRHIEAHNDRSVHLRLHIPLPAGAGSQTPFSFTYRIVYPSGEITWLGHYGYNGMIVLENGNAGQIALSTQDGDWVSNSPDASCVCSISDGISDGLRIAQLADPSAYQIWAIGNDGFLPYCTKTSLVLMTPRAPVLHGHIFPHLYILSASSGALVSMDQSGNITACGKGLITLYTYSYGSQTSTLELVNWLSGLNLQHACRVAHIISSGQNYALLSLVKKAPLGSLILPLTFIPTNQTLRIPLAIFLDMLGKGSSTPLAIYSPNNLDVYFFQSPSSAGLVPDVDTLVTFLVDPSGSQFYASPAHNLQSSRKNDGQGSVIEWSASLLSPFSNMKFANADDAVDILPTPPSSPQLKVAKPSVKLPHTASIDSLGSEEPPPDGGVKAGVGLSLHSSRVHTSDTLVVRSHEMRSDSGLLAYIKYIFLLARIFLGLVFKLFFAKVTDVTELGDEDGMQAVDDPSSSHVLYQHDHEQLQSLSARSRTAYPATPLNPEGEGSRSPPSSSIIDTSVQEHVAINPKAKHTTGSEQGFQGKPDFRSSSSDNKSTLRVQIGEANSIVVALRMTVLAGSNAALAVPPPDTSEILKSISVNEMAPQPERCRIKKRDVKPTGNASMMEHIYLLEFEGGNDDWLNLMAPTVGVVDL